MASTSASAVVAANGTARVQFSPAVYAAKWTLTNITVRSTSALQPTVFIYQNSVSDSNLVNGTFSGIFDVDSDPKLTLAAADSLIVVWVNATPGANCVCAIQFDLDTGRASKLCHSITPL